MSDAELRAVERVLQAEPASIELLRQLARLLQRAGDDLRALSAIDLAWRLGADDLWDELQALLAPRRRTLGGIELAWIPGGPFVLGADDQDDDVAPARLATLPGFWIATAPLRWSAAIGRKDLAPWLLQEPPDADATAWQRELRQTELVCRHDEACDTIAALQRERASPEGAWALPSEEQWERAMRARYLRRHGRSPYGLLEGKQCEWTSGLYPSAERGQGLHVVRGVPDLPPPFRAVYREAAHADGRIASARRARQEPNEIGLRPVLVPPS